MALSHWLSRPGRSVHVLYSYWFETSLDWTKCCYITCLGVASFVRQVVDGVQQGLLVRVGVQVPFGLWLSTVLSQTCRKHRWYVKKTPKNTRTNQPTKKNPYVRFTNKKLQQLMENILCSNKTQYLYAITLIYPVTSAAGSSSCSSSSSRMSSCTSCFKRILVAPVLKVVKAVETAVAVKTQS